ncbi:MAG: NAD(P)-dependent oxidoreductase [Beijerinckiaceae bacterium]|nr:NAD(P)-dependent oxidoreductase [Beijerinckiaceae bacterium]
MRVGYMGVGYMGHGAAKNIKLKGHDLIVLGNRNRKPVEDLLAIGATEAKNPADLASQCDIMFMCLPSTVQVEETVYGPDGVLSVARPGFVLVDSTTSDPDSTRRIGADLRAKGADMVDAPLGRTPKEAELGKLSCFVGGDTATVARVRPVIECFADSIVETGELGSAHTMKLLNNFLAICTSAVVGEGIAAALRLGVDLDVFKKVVDTSGGNGVMFQRFMPWVLEGDDSHMQGMMSIAYKDLKYYRKLAGQSDLVTIMAEAAAQLYALPNRLGHSRQFMSVLPTILANLSDGGKRPLPDR